MEANQELNQNMKQAVEIFEEYENVIRGTIYCNVNDKSKVDDLLHDFFLALVRKPIPSYIQNVKGYLRRAVKNDILDEVVKTKSYHSRNQKYSQLCLNYTRFYNPEDVVIKAETVDNLLEVIETQLLPHEAAALTQKFYFDQDHSQAAEAMGINRRSFSRYLCTGLKKVRQFIHKNKE